MESNDLATPGPANGYFTRRSRRVFYVKCNVRVFVNNSSHNAARGLGAR